MESTPPGTSVPPHFSQFVFISTAIACCLRFPKPLLNPLGRQFVLTSQRVVGHDVRRTIKEKKHESIYPSNRSRSMLRRIYAHGNDVVCATEKRQARRDSTIP